MRLSNTRTFPLLLMLALAALTFWLERTVREEEGVLPALRRHDPDYVVDKLAHTRFNVQGIVESTLAAAKMIHYPDDDSTDLVAPRVVQSKPNEPRVTLTADRGTLSQDGSEMFLYDNVFMLRDGLPGEPGSQLRTNFLHLISARSLVRSDREVQVTEQGRSLVARGMEYDNQTRQLTLHAQVRGTFEPNLK